MREFRYTAAPTRASALRELPAEENRLDLRRVSVLSHQSRRPTRAELTDWLAAVAGREPAPIPLPEDTRA